MSWISSLPTGLYRYDSGSFDPVTKRYILPIGVNSSGRRMLFTGPDGIRNQRVSVVQDHNKYVGIGTMSPEGTSDLDYLYRPSSRDPPSLRPKHKRVSEIGWGIPMYSDRSVLQSQQQIKRGEFRQSAEDRHTHLYQNPWTPPPGRSNSFLNDYRPTTSPMRGRTHNSSQPVARPRSVMEQSPSTFRQSSQESNSQSSIEN